MFQALDHLPHRSIQRCGYAGFFSPVDDSAVHEIDFRLAFGEYVLQHAGDVFRERSRFFGPEFADPRAIQCRVFSRLLRLQKSNRSATVRLAQNAWRLRDATGSAHRLDWLSRPRLASSIAHHGHLSEQWYSSRHARIRAVSASTLAISVRVGSKGPIQVSPLMSYPCAPAQWDGRRGKWCHELHISRARRYSHLLCCPRHFEPSTRRCDHQKCGAT